MGGTDKQTHSGNVHGKCQPPMPSCLYIRVSLISIFPYQVSRRTTHPPQFDETIVTRGDNQGQGRVERHPVNTPVVTLQNELHHCISVSEHICLGGVGAGHLVFEGHGGRGRVLLPQTRNIPNANRLVQRGGGDEVFGGMELRAHYIVVVAGHGADCEAIVSTPRDRWPDSDLLKERFCQFQILMV